MYGAIPDLEIPNIAGACWTCISRFGEGRGDVNNLCDKKLPVCGTCIASGHICEGYHARLRWPQSDRRAREGFEARMALYPNISSLGLAPDDDRLLQHYLRNLSRISVAIDYDGNGWRNLVGIGLNEPALQNALLAVSDAHLARLQQKSASRSRVYLKKSLQNLQARFRDPALLRSEITLMTLLLCESTDRWKHHFLGIAAWCHNRDDLTDIDPFLTTFISMVTTQVLLSAGGPLRQQSYQLLSLLLPTWENRDCVEVILGGPADLPQLVVEACRLDDDFMLARMLSDHDQLGSLLAQAEALQSKIRATQILPEKQVQLSLIRTPDGQRSQRRQSLIVNPVGSMYMYEAARCSSEVFRYALHLFVHRIIYHPLTSGEPSGLVQEATSESLRMLPIIPDTVGPGIFLGWALVVIGAEIDDLEDREFISRRLESLTLLSVNHGVLSLKVLNEVWRRRDALKLGTSACRRLKWQDVMQDMEVDLALV
ncbi:hypothetical protein E8E14_010385 [Neopestalotiopsis sp. 37M]|nr:hypothetical protein E8E14_010385 [Neopestalotiopsis sp. 37M]